MSLVTNNQKIQNDDFAPTAVFTEEETTIDLRQYLTLLLKWWWLIVIVTLVAGGAAYFISKRMQPIYQAATTIMINEAPYNRTSDYTALITSERLAQTYAQIMTKRPVLEEVVRRLQIPLTSEELGGSIEVTPVRDTQLIEITVQNPNPELAAAVANELILVFTDQIRSAQTSRFGQSKESLLEQITETEEQIADTQELISQTKDPAELNRLETRLDQYKQIYANMVLSYEQVQLSEAQSISNVVQVEMAAVPEFPIRPTPFRDTILASLVGFVLAVGGVFAYDLLDDTVKSPEEISKLYKLPVRAVIAQHDKAKEGLITRIEPRSPVSESFRALRVNLQYASVDKPIRTLMITSCAPSDGKTTTIANLGVVLAQSGKRVTLIDADLHRPRQNQLFKLDSTPGLSNLFVQSQLYLNGSVQLTEQENLRLVCSGELPPNPSELLGSKKMQDILETVLEDSDIVLIDTPPVLSLTDALVLAPLVDGVLLVIRPGVTKKSSLKASVEQLRGVGANIIGVVPNRVNTNSSRYGYYYRSYNDKRYYQKNGKKPKN